MKHKGLIKEKANFIKENGVKLYFLRYFKDSITENTVEENLISILLNDKPLKECPKYPELITTLENFNESMIKKEEGENYALLTLFSAVSYVNSAVSDEKSGLELRNKLRNYSSFLNSNVRNSSSVIKIGNKKEQNKVKAKGGI